MRTSLPGTGTLSGAPGVGRGPLSPQGGPSQPRETKEGGRIILEVDGKVAKIRNLKVDSRSDGFGDSREKVVAFGFDYCYWSVNPEDPQYASQDMILGLCKNNVRRSWRR
uniref:StAR related lipid transfer domain containing 9 n=1 Tax=Molossus molossus TaxID=27622 RepID=A0A7J8K194_MOLMO|nr:StAR related lipid transfer domain containing 9 [Molossus molossus]